jgi:hypothetical protein
VGIPMDVLCLFGLYGLSTRAWRAMIDELAEEVTEADKRMGINHPVIELIG